MLARTNTLHLPPISYPSGRGTFIVETNPKCEGRAYDGLRAKGFKPYFPVTLETSSRFRGKRRLVHDVLKPLILGYIFVTFDPNKDEWWEPIKSTDGVKRLLGPNNIPSRVKPGLIEALMNAERNGVFDFRAKPCGLVKGDRVRLAEGPFAGFIGELLIAKPNKRAEVLVKFFGAQRTVETYLANLEKV